jgi:hypothetical protein
MSTNHETCHGQFACLQDCSTAFQPSRISTKWDNLKLTWAHAMWHLQDKGLWGTLKLAISKIRKPLTGERKRPRVLAKSSGLAPDEEVLNLKPGELVEVKSEEDILATLDEKRRYKGLLWMKGMRRFCGKRYRVYKRLERILLETNGELRKVKNTVLLEGVMCDGQEFHGCDRSCFHFWREVWLRRAKQD